MSDEIHHKYRSNLRGNQDVLLADIRRSPEFEAIEQKYLKNVFMGVSTDYSDESRAMMIMLARCMLVPTI